jgi:adenine deaminase
MKNSLRELSNLIKVAVGEKKADLLIKNVKVVDVFSAQLYKAEVAIFKDTIAGVGSGYQAKQVIDAKEMFLAPGFIDGHLHLESTMLLPREFAEATVPRGTTAVVIDPHEIANVWGLRGIKYMLDATQRLPLDFFVMLPSCVPATDLETSGAKLGVDELASLASHPRVLGLAEMMNYPGVINTDEQVLKKLIYFSEEIIDGHAPGIKGKDICAYLSAGPASDHECASAQEARSKLQLGMMIMARQGSTEKNLADLLKLVTAENSRRFMLVSDDIKPVDLLREGHMDYRLHLATQENISPFMAIQMATLNPCSYFGLRRRGAVAPGYRADLVILKNLDNFEIEMTIKDGLIVAKNGEMATKLSYSARVSSSSVNVNLRSLRKLSVPAKPGQKFLGIEIIPGQISTKKFVFAPKINNGKAVADPDRDILKVAVVERHWRSGNLGVGFLRGLGLKNGAIATSVAHDSHNIVVCGSNDADMRLAVYTIVQMDGGLVVASNKKVLASLPLPIAGLMSDQPALKVASRLEKLVEASKALGCKLKNPFMELSFVALPVIPEIKITDLGIVDVKQMRITPLLVG